MREIIYFCLSTVISLSGTASLSEQSKDKGVIDIGVASWNIEQFDAAGPNDTTHPIRTMRHLEMIAETILETRADLIGLQEIMGEEPIKQLIDELNRQEKNRAGPSNHAGSWKGKAGKRRWDRITQAILWNDSTLELIGEITELDALSYGYRRGEFITSKEAYRFPRPPLAGRFRVRASPSNDFTIIVVHLKAGSTGLRGGLDVNDTRRRGEWENLIRKWLLDPTAQGALGDEDIILVGDMNEQAEIIVRLLDEFGTSNDVKERVILDPSDFCDPRASMLITSAGSNLDRDFTFQWNAEKGEKGRRDVIQEDLLSRWRKFLDHILISRSLLDNWDGEFSIEYFEQLYPLEDHVHLSDHRPVSIRLRFPKSESPPLSGKR